MESFLEFFRATLFTAFELGYDMAPYWMPIVLGIAFWQLWTEYTRRAFFAKQKRVLIEVKVPRDTYKSPLAMEVVLGAMHQTGRQGTWFDKYILGKRRPWFSLEIVSINGAIHFFIWTETFFRRTIESQIYAQYPNVEIHEVPDYTQAVPFGQPDSDWGVFGTEFKLTKSDAYPIKTYVDYGLDKDPKEEFKVDPLAQVLEFMGSIGANQQIWIQILIQAHKDAKKPGGIFGKKADWKKDTEEEVKKLRAEYKKKNTEEGADPSPFMTLTKNQDFVLNAMERSVGKHGFETGIRAIYLAKGDAFDPTNIPGLLGVMKQYSSNELNGFAPGQNITAFDFPWQDFNGIRMAQVRATLFNAYVRRSYFYPPYKRPSFVLNTEEVATIYHFPGSVAETPTFERIESRKGEPPANLPFDE